MYGCGLAEGRICWHREDDLLMTDGYPAIRGVVIGTAPDGTLSVELENGQHGKVEYGEISRQGMAGRDQTERLLGRKMGFLVTGTLENGQISLSGRAFEEREYARICEDFREKRRSVYRARLISVTQDGKLAFFRLAQGVNGAMHVSQFSLCRIYSFFEIDLPAEMTVVVTGIDARGRLSISGKPAFGDFDRSMERLDIREGKEIAGMITGLMNDGAASVMLAPNLSVLADVSCRVAPGDSVMLRCRRIDREYRRVKVQMLRRLEGAAQRFPYAAWVRPAEELPLWLDAGEFEQSIRPSKPKTEQRPVRAAVPEEIDFRVSASRSPFAIYPGEKIICPEHPPARQQDIIFEQKMGYLSDRHMKVAGVVDAFGYASAWQIRRYLYLAYGLLLSERELKNAVDRLVKHDILGVLRFQSDEGTLLTRVLYPSVNYRAFTGHNPHSSGPRGLENEALQVKRQMAANQLLIGLMRTWPGEVAVDTHPFLRTGNGDVHVRPRIRLALEDRVYFLEAVRRGCEDEMAEKLLRYNVLLEDGISGVIITAEDEEQRMAMVELTGRIKPGFPVWVTDDLNCLPKTGLTEILPTA